MERMLLRKREFSGLCWIIDIIKDSYGLLRRYLFKEFYGHPLQYGGNQNRITDDENVADTVGGGFAPYFLW